MRRGGRRASDAAPGVVPLLIGALHLWCAGSQAWKVVAPPLLPPPLSRPHLVEVRCEEDDGCCEAHQAGQRHYLLVEHGLQAPGGGGEREGGREGRVGQQAEKASPLCMRQQQRLALGGLACPLATSRHEVASPRGPTCPRNHAACNRAPLTSAGLLSGGAGRGAAAHQRGRDLRKVEGAGGQRAKRRKAQRLPQAQVAPPALENRVVIRGGGGKAYGWPGKGRPRGWAVGCPGRAGAGASRRVGLGSMGKQRLLQQPCRSWGAPWVLAVRRTGRAAPGRRSPWQSRHTASWVPAGCPAARGGWYPSGMRAWAQEGVWCHVRCAAAQSSAARA